MSTTLSRLYNWATDKTNSVKITASRVDAEMDQVITALNRKVLCAASAPANPINGQTWVDTTNNLVKCYLNNAWVIIANYIYIQSATPEGMSEGYLWYDTTNNLLKAYDGSIWKQLGDMIFPSSPAQGDLLYISGTSSSTTTLARLAKSTSSGRVLTNTGSDNNPAWAQVDTTMLKTATGEVSNAGSFANYTLPGGEYGFYPQVKVSAGNGAAAIGGNMEHNFVFTNTSYITNISLVANGGTVYAQQRYVTASGKDFWLFLLVDKETLDVVAAYAAPDHPAYGNGGNFSNFPHPFGNYDKERHIICLADEESVSRVKTEATRERSLLTIVNEDYRVGEENLPYKPLHSGKYITEDNKQVTEMVNSIPDYIKVRKLIKHNK